MINKIKELSNDSKYTTWYCSIIEAAKLRGKGIKGENHHIVPASIWPDGRKLSGNIIRLTYREHYICHKLLLKMLVCNDHRSKMGHALWRLTHKRLNDGIIVNSHEYTIARIAHSAALAMAWKDGKFTGVVDKKRWFYDSEIQKEANRQKALAEMQDPARKEAFVKAGLIAGKATRDADTRAWVEQSMLSEEGKRKSKAFAQSPENREACSRRELSKSKEQRATFAKQGQLALMEKLGGDEAYRKYLSERIKGRKKYIDPITKTIRVLKEPLEGMVLLSEYNKKDKA